MISGWFTKTVICLEQIGIHTYAIHSLKGLIFPYLIESVIWVHSNERWIHNLFYHFYFFIQDSSLNMTFITLILCRLVYDIHLEGTVSHIFYLCLSCNIMLEETKVLATWYRPCPDVCVEKWRIWVPFGLQVNEMNEKMSFKMGVKFAALFYMGGNF